MSYAEYCLPPLSLESKAWRKRKCNVWGSLGINPAKNCHWGKNFAGHRRATNKFNKCLATSEYGRPSFKANGEVCWEKQKGKDKGEQVCAKFDASSNTIGTPFTVQTDPNNIPGNVSQAGLSADKGSWIEQMQAMDQRILIGAAVALLLLAR